MGEDKMQRSQQLRYGSNVYPWENLPCTSYFERFNYLPLYSTLEGVISAQKTYFVIFYKA
jgi:hypothetical protein